MRSWAKRWGNILNWAVGFLLSIATPATADIFNVSVSVSGNIITVVWTGSVISGADNAGLFGPAGANLAGTNVSIVYAFDTSQGESH
jgi:hypothetical protein